MQGVPGYVTITGTTPTRVQAMKKIAGLFMQIMNIVLNMTYSLTKEIVSYICLILPQMCFY